MGGGVDDLPSNIVSTGYYSDTGIWMDAYKQYGQNSYVYKSPEIWRELMTSYIGIIDPATTTLSYQYHIDNNLDIHKYYLYTDPTLAESLPEGTTFSDIKKTLEYERLMFKNVSRITKYMSYKGSLSTELKTTYGFTGTGYNGTSFLISIQRAGLLNNANNNTGGGLSGYYYKIYGESLNTRVEKITAMNDSYNSSISSGLGLIILNKVTISFGSVPVTVLKSGQFSDLNTTFTAIPIPS